MDAAKKATCWQDWIEKRYVVLILGALALGLLAPKAFGSLQGLTKIILVVNMFTLATGCTTREFMSVLRTPGKIIAIIVFAYGGLAALAYGMGQLVFPDAPQITAGLVLIAVLPVAMTSALWTDLAKGDLALTLSIVALTTFSAGIVIPTVMSVVAGQLIEFDSRSLVIDLVKTVIVPTVVGLAFRHRFPAPTQQIRPYLSLGVRLNTFLMMAINTAVMLPYLEGVGLTVVLIVLAVLAQLILSYIAGYGFASLLFSNNLAARISVAYVCGMRNNAAGIVIAVAYFPPLVSLPVILSILIQQPLASFVRQVVLSRVRQTANDPSVVHIS